MNLEFVDKTGALRNKKLTEKQKLSTSHSTCCSSDCPLPSGPASYCEGLQQRESGGYGTVVSLLHPPGSGRDKLARGDEAWQLLWRRRGHGERWALSASCCGEWTAWQMLNRTPRMFSLQSTPLNKKSNII